MQEARHVMPILLNEIMCAMSHDQPIDILDDHNCPCYPLASCGLGSFSMPFALATAGWYLLGIYFYTESLPSSMFYFI